MPTQYRVIRSLVLAALMYFSLWSLGFDPKHALIGASIPFVLGLVNVISPVVFGLTGFVFIAAVAAHVDPARFESLVNRANQTENTIRASGPGMAANILTKMAASISGSGTATSGAPVLSGTNPAPGASGSGAAVSNSPGDNK